MKKLMKSLMLFAAAAMALTSCENEAMNEGIESNDTYTMTFVAGAPESKTSVAINGNEANFSWSVDSEGKLTDRVVFLQTQDANTDVNTKYNDKEKSSISEGVATFVTDFTAIDGATTYNYAAIYPAQSISGTALTSIGVELPASQTLTEGNYDPAADLMMSKVIEGVEAKDGHGGLLQFTRLAAIGKMNLKLTAENGEAIAEDETIEQVTFAIEGAVLNGDVTLNFEEASATYANEGNNIVTIKGSLPIESERTDIFFTCFPGEYTGTYTITVATNKAYYATTGSLSKALSFTAGNVLNFNTTAKWTEDKQTDKVYTKVTKTNLADYSGEYLFVCESKNIAFDGSGTTSADLDKDNNTFAVTIDNNTITGDYSAQAFTIAKVEGGYSVLAAGGLYIGHGGTSNGMSESATFNADTYTNTISDCILYGKGGLALQVYTSGSNNRFRFYTSGKTAVSLYRLNGTGSDEELVKTLESIEVSGAKTTFTVGDEWAFGGTVTAKYNDNSTEDVTEDATVNNSEVNLGTAGEYTVTVTYEDKSTTYTVTVSEEQSGVAGWVKISALSELAAGDKVALVGTVGTTNYSMTTNSTSKAPTAKTVTINGNTLASVDGITTFNIGKDGSNYILYEDDATSTWLYCINDNNGVRSGGTNTNKTWTIAAHSNNGSNFEFKHVGTSRFLGIYNNADWRCYTTVNVTNFTNGKGTSDIAIYKYTAGSGDVTPDPEGPVQLATPAVDEAVSGNTVTLTWDEVANASSYTVTYGTTTIENATSPCVISDLAYNTTYDFSVVAVGDGTNYTNSEAATASATTEADGIVDPTPTVKTYTFTIDTSYFNSKSYSNNDNEKTSTATATDGSTMEVKWTSSNVMLQNNVIQFKKKVGYIYNSTDLGTITNITITSTAGTYTQYIGSSTQPTTTNGTGGYFKIQETNNTTGKVSSIVITFQK